MLKKKKYVLYKKLVKEKENHDEASKYSGHV